MPLLLSCLYIWFILIMFFFSFLFFFLFFLYDLLLTPVLFWTRSCCLFSLLPGWISEGGQKKRDT